MKTTFSMSLLTSILLAGGMLACEDDIINIHPELPPGSFSIVDGDTIRTKKNENFNKPSKLFQSRNAVITFEDTIVTYQEAKLPKLPSKVPDLKKIKNDKDPDLKGKNLRMIVIGGNLSSGVREGSYNNEIILSSYPNLVARQMRLEKFENPLFEKEEYNGIGKHVPTSANITGGPFQKFKKANNNLAFTDFNEAKGLYIGLKPYKGDPDNFSFPYAPTKDLIIGNPEQEIAFGQPFGRFMESKKDSKYATGIYERIASKKYDFYIYELGNDAFFRSLTNFGTDGFGIDPSNLDVIEREYKDDWERLRSRGEIRIMKEYLVPSGAKGVLLNVPDWLTSPYIVDNKLIEKALIKEKGENTKLENFINAVIFLQSPGVDSILSNQVPYLLKPLIDEKHPLKYVSEWRAKSELGSFANLLFIYNDMVQRMSKAYNVPVVDIKGLVSRVVGGGFINEFGTRISKDNFFSKDNLYPSALGQVLIANEVIKTINSHYGLEIELINTSETL